MFILLAIYFANTPYFNLHFYKFASRTVEDKFLCSFTVCLVQAFNFLIIPLFLHTAYVRSVFGCFLVNL